MLAVPVAPATLAVPATPVVPATPAVPVRLEVPGSLAAPGAPARRKAERRGLLAAETGDQVAGVLARLRGGARRLGRAGLGSDRPSRR